MEILIKLDKRLYKYAKHHTLTSGEMDGICDAIASGTPLPKGHGRLIDADALIKDVRDNSESYFADDFAHEWVDVAPTIIDADRSEEK